jgi:hypothetical protein
MQKPDLEQLLQYWDSVLTPILEIRIAIGTKSQHRLGYKVCQGMHSGSLMHQNALSFSIGNRVR